MNTEQDDVTKD